MSGFIDGICLARGVGGVFEAGMDGFANHAVVFGKEDAHRGSWCAGRSGKAITARRNQTGGDALRQPPLLVSAMIYSHPPKVSDKARRRRQYAVVRRGFP